MGVAANVRLVAVGMVASLMELLLGCGSSREMRLMVDGTTKWRRLVTLDHNADHKPDVVADLEQPLPFRDETFDRLDAYEVIEHLGRQGDWRSFFAQFSEFWRVLKPGGYFAATCPSWRSMWAWSDPSHTRVISHGTLSFLSQEEYRKQVGRTPMSDFRFCYKADFEPVRLDENKLALWDDGEQFSFILQAIKPARLN